MTDPKNRFPDKLKRLFFMGPIVLFFIVSLIILGYLAGRSLSWYMEMPFLVKVALTAMFGTLFLLGYGWFLLTFLKHDIGKKVLQSGPYAIVRHPLYSTDVFTLPPIVFLWTENFGVLAAGFLTIGLLHFLVKPEEKYMIKNFGDEYKEYRKRIPAFIPFFPGSK